MNWQQKVHVTEKDRIQIANGIAERAKDIFFMNFKNKVYKTLSIDELEALLQKDSADILDISYNFRFCAGDIQQMVGHIRRHSLGEKLHNLIRVTEEEK